jgi:CheY-like chemotaxis protein
VKQSRGHVHVYSEPGIGTTFKVYLPLVPEVTAVPALWPDTPARLTGSETVLLCEDEPLVRSLMERILRRSGYDVLTTQDPAEALELATQRPDVDILVTDVVMPGLSGPELVERVRIVRPDLRALLLSGYPVEMIRDRATLPFGTGFLEKPFHAEGLLRAVRGLVEPTCTNRS